MRKTWPTALTLFGARLAALWLGTYCGTSLATRATRGSAAHGAADERCGGRREASGLSAEEEGAGLHAVSEVDGRCTGWMAYVTQAGITLGLSDEVAANFPSWGPSLQVALVVHCLHPPTLSSDPTPPRPRSPSDEITAPHLSVGQAPLVCMRTCMHACVHACVRAYMHAHVHVHVRACVHAYMRACVHACMRACVRASIHAYVWQAPLVSAVVLTQIVG